MRTATLFLVLATIALGAPINTQTSALGRALSGYDQSSHGHSACDKSHEKCNAHHLRSSQDAHESDNHVQIGHYDTEAKVPTVSEQQRHEPLSAPSSLSAGERPTERQVSDNQGEYSQDDHMDHGKSAHKNGKQDHRDLYSREPHRDKADRPDRHGEKHGQGRHGSHGKGDKHDLLESTVVDTQVGVGHDRHHANNGNKNGGKKKQSRSISTRDNGAQGAHQRRGQRARPRHDEDDGNSSEEDRPGDVMMKARAVTQVAGPASLATRRGNKPEEEGQSYGAGLRRENIDQTGANHAARSEVTQRSKDSQHYTADVGYADETDGLASTDLRAGETKEPGQYVQSRSESGTASEPNYDITDAKAHAEIMGDGWKAKHAHDGEEGHRGPLERDYANLPLL